MEKYKKLNVISAVLIVLSISIYHFYFFVIDKLNESHFFFILWKFVFFIIPIFLIVSFILSAKSIKIKRNFWGIVLLICTIFPLWFIIWCLLTGYL